MTDEASPRRTIIPQVAAESVALGLKEGDETLIHEFLGFRLANENYALPLRSVREILKLPPVTPVPRAMRHVIGIITVRGRVITVIDLRRRLRMTELPISKHTRVLLVDEGEETLGLLVDQVLQVFRLREDELELAAAMGGDTAEYVLGVGRPRTAGRAGGRLSPRILETPLEKEDILILLDPKQLLRK